MSTRKVVGIEQARAQLPAIVAQAHQGQISVVTRHGKPVAAIVPMDMARAHHRQPGLLALRGSAKGLWRGVQGLKALRGEWD